MNILERGAGVFAGGIIGSASATILQNFIGNKTPEQAANLWTTYASGFISGAVLAAKTTQTGESLRDKTLEIIKDSLKAAVVTNIALSATVLDLEKVDTERLFMGGTVASILLI